MKKIPVLLIILIATFLSYSCMQEITLDIPNSGPLLVVQGEISTETDSSFINLTQTVSYYSSDPIPTVDNAIVSVNGIPFKSKGNGIYKADAPFAGVINSIYHLNIVYKGTTYTASSQLDPMFNIDSVGDVYTSNGNGFRNRTGYLLSMWWTDTRPSGKYTYIRYGRNQTDFSQDSFFRNIILLDNAQTKLNAQISYQLPRLYQPGDSVFAILKSCDHNMYYFLQSYQMQNSNAPGPFQIPPANLPTNITGGAVGYFTACDVRRFRKGL